MKKQIFKFVSWLALGFILLWLFQDIKTAISAIVVTIFIFATGFFSGQIRIRNKKFFIPTDHNRSLRALERLKKIKATSKS